MQIYPPRRVRRRLPEAPTGGLDRFALGFAIFSAFTFFGTLAMLCAVFTLAALLMRNDLRWTQSAGFPAGAPVSPLANVESPLPTETPTDTATPEPTATLPEVPVETPALLEPTATVEPFWTETPTPPLPVSPLDTTGSDFAVQATTHIGSMLATLNQLTVLVADPQIGDVNWQSQLDSQLTTARNSYHALVVLQPPPELAALHNTIINASAACLGGLNTIEQAVRFNDAPMVQNGLNEVNNCLPALADTNSQLSSQVYGGNVP